MGLSGSIFKMRKRLDLISDTLNPNTEQLPFFCALCQALYTYTTSYGEVLLLPPGALRFGEVTSLGPQSQDTSFMHLCTLCQVLFRPETATGKRLKAPTFVELVLQWDTQAVNRHVMSGVASVREGKRRYL